MKNEQLKKTIKYIDQKEKWLLNELEWLKETKKELTLKLIQNERKNENDE